MKLPSHCFVLAVLLGFILPCHGEEPPGNTNPNGNAGDYNGSVTTAGSYDPFTGNASRSIDDIVVPGSVGAYPLKWTRRLNTRGPASIWNSRIGDAGGWSHSYDWHLVVNHPVEPPDPPDPNHPDTRSHATLTYPDGRFVEWGKYDPLSESADPSFFQPGTLIAADQTPFGMRDRFVNCQANGGCQSGADYELLMADGGVVKFVKPIPSHPYCYATEIVDPYGQVTTLEYDSGRLHKIIEPAGRYLEIYPSSSLPPGLVSRVEANDGLGHVTQTVSYQYQQFNFHPGHPQHYYYLTGVDYDDGTHASYGYQGSNRPPQYQGDDHGSVIGLVRTCQDVRFGGPMKNIMYEYRTLFAGLGEVAWGQIRQEKNIFGLVLSELEFPQPLPGQIPDDTRRTERRPGSNVTREFQYNIENPYRPYVGGFSDYLHPPNWTYFHSSYNSSDGTSHFLITDARNKTTDKQTEPIFNATIRVTHPAPNSSYVETVYTDPDRPHYVASRRDENGHTTTYARNKDTHEVEQIDYPNGGWESFVYNDFKQIKDHTMTNGGTEHFEYDTRGLKIRFWPPATPSDPVPDQNKTRYLYYDAGNSAGRFDRIDRLWKVIDPLGHTTTYDYNKRGQTVRVTHDDGNFKQSKYNDGDGTPKADGTLAWTADENHPDAGVGGHENERTQYLYDEYKRVTDVINPLGEITSSDYTPRNGLSALSHTTSSVYRVTTPGSSTFAAKVTEYDYDLNFRRTMIRQGPNTSDQATTYQLYDEVGNLSRIEDPRGVTTTFGYDERNRQTSIRNDFLNETTEIQYDSVGNKIKETRPDTAARTWTYDVMNRLWHFYDWRLPSGGGGTLFELEAATTTYGRDLAGNVLTITDRKGAVYLYEYDKLNRKISLTNPPAVPNASRTETWLYDIAGNLFRYKNPANQARKLHYDSRNRPDHSWWSFNEGPDIVTRYDPASRIIAVLANSAAQATIMGGAAPDDVVYAETKIYFGYDTANRKIWEDQILDGHTARRIQTDLNPDGTRRNLQITSPHPGTLVDPLSTAEMPVGGPYFVEYGYTGRNQLQSITGEDWSFTYSYDLSGNMASRIAQYNGYSSSVGCPDYDARNRAKTWEQSSSGVGGTYARSHYRYDSANREVATWREEQNNLGERFTYSPTNQLTNVAYNAAGVEGGNPSNATRTVSYQYTDKLNRSIVTDTPQLGTPLVTNYSAVPLNQYSSVGGVTYSYDDNFNLTGTPGLTASYDGANQIVSATGHHPYTGDDQVEYVYDGLGRCVKQSINGVATIFLYDGWKAIAEFDDWNYFQAWNVYGPGPDEILLRYNSQGKYGYIRFQQDRHGNVAFLLDNDGQVVEKYTYDAFGHPKIADPSGPGEHHYSYYGHRFLFQGRDYFHELGLYDYRHRLYHPGIGRFIQTDPKGFEAGDMNLFRYVGDDPVDGSDPMGLSDLNYIPDWDVNTLHLVNSFLNRGFYSRWINGEGPKKMVVVSAHGARGYVMNTNVTKPAFEASRDRKIPVPGPMRLDIKQLVQDIQGRDNYTPTKPIRLDICYAGYGGANSVAQQVATGLKTNQVTANTDTVRPDNGTGAGEWRDFNSPESKRPTDVLNKSVRTYLNKNGQPSLGADGGSSTESDTPSAKDVDLAHQATGVPSLGAEAVNCAPGRP